jgi:hypothetical protein
MISLSRSTSISPHQGSIGTRHAMKVDNTVEVISQPPHVSQRRTTAVIYVPD